jgi:CRISPR-associated protein Csb3
MSTPTIRIQVDPTNPGQFLACCGLLELADRAYGEATGAFVQEDRAEWFEISTTVPSNAGELLTHLSECPITSTLSPAELSRLKVMLNKSKDSMTVQEKAEKTALGVEWNGERIHFGAPFDIWIDWWNDDLTGGSRFKTWAGKQLVWEILDALQRSLRKRAWDEGVSVNCLFERFADGNLPLYFDTDIGAHSSSIDVGFSLDALGMRSSIRSVIELAAFVGLQRFRPRHFGDSLTYTVWRAPLSPLLAAVAAAGVLREQASDTYEFGILFRSKYLKSFLPAHQPIQNP